MEGGRFHRRIADAGSCTPVPQNALVALPIRLANLRTLRRSRLAEPSPEASKSTARLLRSSARPWTGQGSRQLILDDAGELLPEPMMLSDEVGVVWLNRAREKRLHDLPEVHAQAWDGRVLRVRHLE